jgi:hypothetical protein
MNATPLDVVVTNGKRIIGEHLFVARRHEAAVERTMLTGGRAGRRCASRASPA